MKLPTLLALAWITTIFTQLLSAQTSPADTRNLLDQWVETRQLISKEKSDWQVESSILQDTQSLLSKELDRANQALESLTHPATAAEEERTQLAAQKDELSQAAAVLVARIGALEAQMRQRIPTLPEPLLEQIKPLIRRLPSDSSQTQLSLGERVQNLVGILSQTDKFNNTLTVTSESREITAGKRVQVQTLYWGLAMAYYVDASGQYAGIGYPSDNGWEWPQIEGAGAAIQKLLGVYTGDEAIQFVEVPAQLR